MGYLRYVSEAKVAQRVGTAYAYAGWSASRTSLAPDIRPNQYHELSTPEANRTVTTAEPQITLGASTY